METLPSGSDSYDLSKYFCWSTSPPCSNFPPNVSVIKSSRLGFKFSSFCLFSVSAHGNHIDNSKKWNQSAEAELRFSSQWIIIVVETNLLHLRGSHITKEHHKTYIIHVMHNMIQSGLLLNGTIFLGRLFSLHLN